MSLSSNLEKEIFKKKKNSLDKKLGELLKFFRKLNGFTQTRLANSVEITFQQIQKYEKGESSMTFSMLVMICKSLKCDIVEFVSKINDECFGKMSASEKKDSEFSIEVAEMIRLLNKVKPENRKIAMNFLKTLS